VLAHDISTSAPDANRRNVLAALRRVEVAELLRVITTLRVEGLLSDAEYHAKRRHLVDVH
jgi:hypothetical protein